MGYVRLDNSAEWPPTPGVKAGSRADSGSPLGSIGSPIDECHGETTSSRALIDVTHRYGKAVALDSVDLVFPPTR